MISLIGQRLGVVRIQIVIRTYHALAALLGCGHCFEEMPFFACLSAVIGYNGICRSGTEPERFISHTRPLLGAAGA